MRVLVIPDIHLKPWIFDRTEKILRDGKADRAVCLMDMPDDWNMEFQIERYKETFDRAIAFAEDYPDTLWCYGNHDVSYSWGRLETGYSPYAERTVMSKLEELENRLKSPVQINIMHRIDNVLFSHGGLTADFLRWLNKDLLDADIEEVIATVNDAPHDYLWNDKSPLWFRPQYETREMFRADTYKQVVGHTPVEKIFEKDGIISTDVFSTYRDGRQIGESAMIVIDSETGEYEKILVDRADLMNQWIKRLEEFLDIDEELPEYQTKTGRTRKRKSLIGNLQGAHDTLTGIVDVAMIRSLKKKDGFHPKLKEYAQVYFDECHHAASDSAIEVLQEINAKYVYGVTATPKRGDGKEKINEFLLGPIRYRFTAKDRAEEQNINHLVYPRFTRTVKPHHLSKTPYGNDAYELIRNNDVRDEQIIRDVADCVQAGRTPVVLTKYVDHAKKLSERLKTYADRLILLTGANGTKARRAQVEELNKVDNSDSLILVGTGSLLGEGFDFPRLDTLFMATPVSGENVVEQYVGRLNRDYDGKENVIVYDYVDSHIPKFDKMYSARMKAYKKIGYELCVNMDGEKQKANAIYDIENYAETYWKDLEEANSAVVVSSPRLNNQKVDRIIKILGKRRELGVKVTIVTWHPDAYKYGKDDVRMELMERLRKAGFEIRLVEESCEHYAVIDNEIVWYGSVNLLSKEDAEDNLMRVCSKDIAAELLEMTFGSEIELQEW